MSDSIIFTGGREISVKVKSIPSNYHAAEVGEEQVMISSLDGQSVSVSVETLEYILQWAKKNVKSVKVR
jgi:hypothetical protein